MKTLIRLLILLLLIGLPSPRLWADDYQSLPSLMPSTSSDAPSAATPAALTPNGTFPVQKPVETRAQAWARSPWNRLSLLAGPAILSADQADTAVGLALRGAFLSYFSLEVGGVLPGNVTDGFRSTMGMLIRPPGETYRAQVSTLSEFHLQLNGDFPIPGAQDIAGGEVGVGASMLRATDTLTQTVNGSSIEPPLAVTPVSSWSPLVSFGIRLLPQNPYLSILMLVSWSHYSNRFADSGQTFDLSFTGWTFRPLFQLKF